MTRRSLIGPLLRHASLAACLLSLVLVIVSTCRTILWIDSSGTLSILAESGSLAVRHRTGAWIDPFPFHAGWSSYTAPDTDAWPWLPHYESCDIWGANFTELSIPLWIPLILFAVPPFVWMVRRQPWPDGHCQNCGYNLTGNVSGTCPECGTSTAPGTE